MVKKIGLLLLIAGLSGCASPRATPPVEARMTEALDQAIASHQPAPEPPAEVMESLLPELDTQTPAKVREERFDISVEGANPRHFFMDLVSGTPYNMVVHPQVSGTISLRLNNVTIPEVMETVRDVFGFEYRRSGNSFRVLPARLQSRIFQINYLNIERSGTSQTRVSSGQVSESGEANSGERVTGSRIDTATQSKFWSELAGTLQAIIGSEAGRSVTVSPQSGVIIVRAFPQELRDVDAYLKTVEEVLHRQVILEAKILEVELKDGFQSGINWAALEVSDTGKQYLAGQTGGGSIFGGTGTSTLNGETGNLDPLNYSGVAGNNTSAFGGVFTLAAQAGDFTAFIELLKTQGQVQVLSSPRVSTVNNQKAVIKVGSDEFFVTDVSSETNATTGSAVQSLDITLTPFFSGIALDVTPQIAQNGDVILHIHPSVSEVDDQNKVVTVGSQVQNLPLAMSSVRETDSVIRARNGQVVVLGGLMQTQTVDESARTPFLGDLPLLGALFRHNKQATRKSELVILLRPIVVGEDRVWQEYLRETRDGFGQLQGQRSAP